MPIVRHSRTGGNELTPEEQEAAKLRIQEAARRPYVYDPDSPLITEEQLSGWKPVNFATMEERAEAMRAAGIGSPDMEEKSLYNGERDLQASGWYRINPGRSGDA